MSGVAKRKAHKEGGRMNMGGLRSETKRGIVGIALFALAVVLLLAAFEAAGFVGREVFKGLSYVVGVGYYLLPPLFLILGIAFIKDVDRRFSYLQMGSAIVLFFSSLGLVEFASGSGGMLGELLAAPLLSLFDIYATFIILSAFIIISLLILFDAQLRVPLPLFIKKVLTQENEPGVTVAGYEEKEALEEEEELQGEMPEHDAREEDADAVVRAGETENVRGGTPFPFTGVPYTPPPLSLLERDRGKPGVGDIKANANIISRTLANFGISVEMDEVSIGPSVTRYAVKPAEGVRLSKIVSLQSNLELALAAHPIRIEAPIPGKSLVGIEVPNSAKVTVGLATILSIEEFQNSSKRLFVALGRDIVGKSHFANLAKMPHILIAGATGAGKSVAIHVLINSLLYRNSPEHLRLIMIDPKRVELTLYNDIPHLLSPVITDPKKAILALKWATKEMERRYNILETEKVRDIESYHGNVLAPALEKLARKGRGEEAETPETMPYIVIVIDELSDIMQTYPRELEAAVVRLAQMSRAVGIHLILSTQRPSVNVITGLIKANIPARIALQVASQVDSRTILDGSGAEKLLGAGDMLFLSGEMSKPMRLQSPFISETEVKKVVKFIVGNNEIAVPNELGFSGNGDDALGKGILFDSLMEEGAEDDDELYEQARLAVMEAGKASTSYIQRKLRVGYARAARLMDMLEERGVIGPQDGAKPREVHLAAPGTPEETPP